MFLVGSAEEIVFHTIQIVDISQAGELLLGADAAAEGLTVAELLDVVQAAGNTAVAVRVKGVEGDRHAAVATGIDLRAVKDRLGVRVHDTGSLVAVRVQEVAAGIGRIIGAVQIAVAERGLQGLELRQGALALQLALALAVRRLDGRVDAINRLDIGLRDDGRHGVLGLPAVDGLGFPDMAIGEAGAGAGNDAGGGGRLGGGCRSGFVHMGYLPFKNIGLGALERDRISNIRITVSEKVGRKEPSLSAHPTPVR